MSILADSLGPSYRPGISPGLQECQDSVSVPVPLPESGRQQRQSQARQRKDSQARAEKDRPAARHAGEASVPGIPMDSPFDVFSGLVDFELFEQSMQSPDNDDDSSRNSQAPVDLDAKALLSSYQQLFDAQQPATTTTTTAAAASAFPPVF